MSTSTEWHPFDGPLDCTTAIDADRLAATRALFDESLDELIARTAQVPLAAKPVRVSPIVLTHSCATRPPCRHCKWGHSQTPSKGPFVLDAPIENLIAQAHTLADLGIERAFMATGWLGYRMPPRFVDAVAAIHEAEPRLELYGLFGALSRQSTIDLAHAGLTGMLTSLEFPCERVFRSVRLGGDSLSDRLAALDYAREAGLRLWTGFLVGMGETADEVAEGLELIRAVDPESVSILPFEPCPGTPMADAEPTDPAWLARVVAVARLSLPRVGHFFTDHALGFDPYAERLGLNGSYETRVP